jgi:EpsI family protein
MNNKNFLIVVATLILVTIISFPAFMSCYETQSEIKMADFPKTILNWTSQDLPVSERTYRLLETRNLITRNYINQNQDTVNLFIIYSQDNRKVVDPPEIYLQGAGESITSKSSVQLANAIKATELTLEKGLSRELVVYWYRSGKLNTNLYLKQQLKVVIDRMLGKKTSVVLIRVSTKIEDSQQDAALTKIKGFCALIEPLLDRYVP